MSEREPDDYLWDKSGPVDPEVQRLEGLLGRYRWRAGAHAHPAHLDRPRARTRLLSFPFPLVGVLAAAGIAAALVIFWALSRDPGPGYRLIGVDGSEIVRAGDEISTGAGENARVEIGWLGHVDLQPHTKLRVEECGENSHRLYLSQGSVSARIWAQPRLFRIGSPAGEAIDLGCAYHMDVSADGTISKLRVTSGQVAFEFEGREIYVPAGAVCESIQGRGPGAPVFESSSAGFKSAVAEAEFASPIGDEVVRRLIDLAEREDSLTLWHLFTSERTDPVLRRAAFEKLSLVFPMPTDVAITEPGLFAGDREMCEAWMEEMKPAWR